MIDIEIPIEPTDWTSKPQPDPVREGPFFVCLKISETNYWYTSAKFLPTLTSYGWFYSTDGIKFDKPCKPESWSYI